MKPRICICCGEPMMEKGNALSRNPNMCASCSSMLDGGLEAERSLPSVPAADQSQPPPKPLVDSQLRAPPLPETAPPADPRPSPPVEASR